MRRRWNDRYCLRRLRDCRRSPSPPGAPHIGRTTRLCAQGCPWINAKFRKTCEGSGAYFIACGSSSCSAEAPAPRDRARGGARGEARRDRQADERLAVAQATREDGEREEVGREARGARPEKRLLRAQREVGEGAGQRLDAVECHFFPGRLVGEELAQQ